MKVKSNQNYETKLRQTWFRLWESDTPIRYTFPYDARNRQISRRKKGQSHHSRMPLHSWVPPLPLGWNCCNKNLLSFCVSVYRRNQNIYDVFIIVYLTAELVFYLAYPLLCPVSRRETQRTLSLENQCQCSMTCPPRRCIHWSGKYRRMPLPPYEA